MTRVEFLPGLRRFQAFPFQSELSDLESQQAYGHHVILLDDQLPRHTALAAGLTV